MKKLIATLIFLLVPYSLYPQAVVSPTPKLQFLDTTGTPLDGCLIHTYEAGTTTPIVTYQDHAEVASNPNPVVCDSGGFASIWLVPGTSYKFVVANSSDVTQYTVDGLRVGVSSAPFITNSADPASTGIVRLANADQICWRNSTNTNDICISVDSNNHFIIPATTDITGDLNVSGDTNVGGDVNVGGTVNSTTSVSTGNGANSIVSGGLAYWTGTGYNYIVQQTVANFGGTTVSADQTSITLAAADPTNPRIDKLYIDINGTISKITGTAAPAPVEPALTDPTTQISLGIIEVAAGSTTPSGASVTDIYQENAGTPTEWDCTSDASWDCADTTNPFAGTYDIKSDGSSITDEVTLTASAAADLSSNNIFKLELDSAANWSGHDEVWVSWYNGSTPVGNTVFSSSNTYGWNGIGGSYQLVLIPMTAFGIGSTSVDSVKIRWNKGGNAVTSKTIYLDSIQIEQNSVTGRPGVGGGSLTNATLHGDGTVFPSTLPSGCDSTTNFNCTLTLASAPPNYFLRGPVGSLGTNVGVRQSKGCDLTGGASTGTCTYGTALQSGDWILATVAEDGATGTFSASDSLGNTISLHTTGTSGVYIMEGQTSTSGADTVTISTTGSFGTHNPTVVIFELVGVSAYHAVGGCAWNVGNSSCTTSSVTPSASTDGVIQVLQERQNSGSFSTSSLGVSPVASLFDSYAFPSTMVGRSWIYAPGSTASYSATFSGPTLGLNQTFSGVVVDFVQSASAGSAPWVAGPIKEGDLPASAISAIQSVNRYNLSSNFALTAGSDNTVFSKAITMPSDGCPCRVLAQYGLFLKAGSSAMPWDVWMSDGTNVFNGWEMETTDDTKPSANSSAMSPVSYANNQTVTFSVHVQMDAGATSTFVYQNATAGGAKSFMTLSVMQSRN